MVQAVISRLANNSSSMKALSGTLVAATVALYGTISNPHWSYLIGILLPLLLFWLLDAHYLRIECAYRNLYDAIRKNQHTDEFSMDYKLYLVDVSGLMYKMLSWSVGPLYLALSIAVLLIALTNSSTCEAIATSGAQ